MSGKQLTFIDPFTNNKEVDKGIFNIFSFFSGAGFLDLGFELAGGYDIVYVNEFHKAFNDVYKYSRKMMGLGQPKYGHHVEDITTLLDSDKMVLLRKQIEESKSERITGIIGGPPCPDFSVAGKNKGKDGENGKLSGIYTEIICQATPDFFLFENVKGLYRTSRHREFFEQLKRKFKESGYSLTEKLINTLEYGVPQERERIILIGIHQRILDNTDIPNKDGQLLNFGWDEFKKYNIEDIRNCNWPTTSVYHEDVPTTAPEGIIPELTVQYWWDKNDVTHHPNAKMYFTPRAGLYRFQTKDEGDDQKKCYKRLHRWRYSPTVAYGNNEVHIHPYKPRRISVAEALALQSLPKEYVLPDDITLTDAFKTIGNGVPFLAANCIAKSLHNYINKYSKK